MAKRAYIVRKLITRFQIWMHLLLVRTMYHLKAGVLLAFGWSWHNSSKSTPVNAAGSTRPINFRNLIEDLSFRHRNLMRSYFSMGSIWSKGLLQMNFSVRTLSKALFSLPEPEINS